MIKYTQKKDEIVKLILWCIIIILGACIIRRIFKPTLINGTSMEPTYTQNQFLIGHICLSVDRFDVVTVDVDDKLLIKRVIGLPGETIEFIDGQLYVDGTLT